MNPVAPRRALRPALALLLLLGLLAAPPARADVRWKERSYALDKLPSELAPEVALAAAPWEAWAKAKGYQLWLNDAGDCLLVADRKSSGVQESLGLIHATIAAVDRILPPRAGEPAAAPAPSAPSRDQPLEDFDLPPPGVAGPGEQPRIAHQVPVLLAARGPADYESALGMLVKAHPWLSGWASQTGEGVYGMALPRPLVGAWLVNAPENEEWDPRNELVHRLAQLLLLDRGGHLPYWMLVGTAWNIELEVRGGIYCFPYRYGFVGIGEHGGWAPALSSRFKAPRGTPVDADSVCALRRGTYEDDQAALAWGGMGWMIAEQRAALPALFADLDLACRKQAMEVAADGTWRSLPQWEWPVATQNDLLRRHLGRDVWERMTLAFRAGI